MPPFASNQVDLNDDDGKDLFSQTPFVGTRKHMETEIPPPDKILMETEIAVEELSTLASASSKSPPTFFGNLFACNPCAAFDSCSNDPTPRIPIAPPPVLEINSCVECRRSLGSHRSFVKKTRSNLRELSVVENMNMRIPSCTDSRVVSEQEKKVNIDIVVGAKSSIYCQDCCAAIKAKHEMIHKSVLIELLTKDQEPTEKNVESVDGSESLNEWVPIDVEPKYSGKKKGFKKHAMKIISTRVYNLMSVCDRLNESIMVRIERERKRKKKGSGKNNLATMKRESKSLHKLISFCVDRENNEKKSIGNKSLDAMKKVSKRLDEVIEVCVDRVRNSKTKRKGLGSKNLAAIKRISERLDKLIKTSVNSERNRKRMNSVKNALSALKKSTMNTFSLQKSKSKKQFDTDDESDCSQRLERKQDIEQIYSSPNCIHYRFNNLENSQENITKHRSLIKLARVAYSSVRGRRCRSTGDRSEESLQVKTVAVIW